MKLCYAVFVLLYCSVFNRSLQTDETMLHCQCAPVWREESSEPLYYLCSPDQ
ncbi:hypothetical protein scyTo_0018470, partial [Scyliorhinus torazame]|nr:hypothetical protein [Scyliorhinus torazame]